MLKASRQTSLTPSPTSKWLANIPRRWPYFWIVLDFQKSGLKSEVNARLTQPPLMKPPCSVKHPCQFPLPTLYRQPLPSGTGISLIDVVAPFSFHSLLPHAPYKKKLLLSFRVSGTNDPEGDPRRGRKEQLPVIAAMNCLPQTILSPQIKQRNSTISPWKDCAEHHAKPPQKKARKWRG